MTAGCGWRTRAYAMASSDFRVLDSATLQPIRGTAFDLLDRTEEAKLAWIEAPPSERPPPVSPMGPADPPKKPRTPVVAQPTSFAEPPSFTAPLWPLAPLEEAARASGITRSDFELLAWDQNPAAALFSIARGRDEQGPRWDLRRPATRHRGHVDRRLRRRPLPAGRRHAATTPDPHGRRASPANDWSDDGTRGSVARPRGRPRAARRPSLPRSDGQRAALAHVLSRLVTEAARRWYEQPACRPASASTSTRSPPCRNSRGGEVPSVIEAVRVILGAGCRGITVHPRADERHITTQRRARRSRPELEPLRDARRVQHRGRPAPRSARPGVPAAAATSARSCRSSPARSRARPGGRAGHAARVDRRDRPPDPGAGGMRVELFVDAEPDADPLGRRAGGRAHRAVHRAVRRAPSRRGRAPPRARAFGAAATLAHELGLGVNAGHDLDLDNLCCFGVCRTSTRSRSATR